MAQIPACFLEGQSNLICNSVISLTQNIFFLEIHLLMHLNVLTSAMKRHNFPTSPTISTSLSYFLSYVFPITYFLFLCPTCYFLLTTSNFLLPISSSYFLLPTSYSLLPTHYFLLPTSYFLLPTSSYLSITFLQALLDCLGPFLKQEKKKKKNYII